MTAFTYKVQCVTIRGKNSHGVCVVCCMVVPGFSLFTYPVVWEPMTRHVRWQKLSIKGIERVDTKTSIWCATNSLTMDRSKKIGEVRHFLCFFVVVRENCIFVVVKFLLQTGCSCVKLFTSKYSTVGCMLLYKYVDSIDLVYMMLQVDRGVCVRLLNECITDRNLKSVRRSRRVREIAYANIFICWTNRVSCWIGHS